jgi:hypothetical protein
VAESYLKIIGNFFRGVYGAGVGNSATWLFVILAFSRWSSASGLSLALACMIAFSDYLARKAVHTEAYSRAADEAHTAIQDCLTGYDITEIEAGSAIGKLGAFKTELDAATRVFLLAPKRDYEPFLTLKAFLQPPNSYCGTVVLLPHAEEFGVMQRFSLLHELSHSSPAGHIWELNGTSPLLRLWPTYVAIGLACANWYLAGPLLILLLINGFISENEVLMETDADWNAWKSYFRIFGREETIAATGLIEHFFSLKARLADQPKLFKGRAELAANFRRALQVSSSSHLSRILQWPSLSLPVTLRKAVLIGIVAVAIGFWQAVPEKPPIGLLIFPFVVMWLNIIRDFLIRKRLATSSYRLSLLLTLLPFPAVLQRLKEAQNCKG